MKAELNQRLTQVGPRTPGGELLRRYWQPVALLDEFDPALDPSMAVRPVKAVRVNVLKPGTKARTVGARKEDLTCVYLSGSTVLTFLALAEGDLDAELGEREGQEPGARGHREIRIGRAEIGHRREPGHKGLAREARADHGSVRRVVDIRAYPPSSP